MSHRHAVGRKARPATPRLSTGSGHRPLALALALASGFGMVPALAQPAGAQAVVGSATLSQQGSKLLVTTTNGAGQSHSTINWQSFNVPAGTTTWFAQPNAASTSINRVLGADPSAIFGTLGSNGRLVLVNPAGITVGAGAVVDTAGFIASTLRMSDADALAGRLRFGDGAAAGLLKVDGGILARSGDVVLIGRDVEVGTPAVVRSPQGATVLAAGRQAEVTGRGLEGIVFTLQAPTDSAVNLGNLSGDAVGVFAGTLRHSGLAQASAVSTEGGRVVLRASDTALVAGTAQAQGLAGAGGSIDVLGDKVGLLAGAVLDTSNTAGGGQIRVGGGYQGQDTSVTNAQVAYVDRGATLRADATAAGDGGRIVVWSDDTTRAYGSFSVQAGSQGGNGGLVETSGKRFLDVEGARVTAGAAQGRMGTWLLDPDDVVITPQATTSPAQAYGTATPTPTSDPATAIFTPATTGKASVIYDSTLNTALNASNGAYVRVLAGTSSVYSTSTGIGTGAIRLVGDVTLGRTTAGGATLELSAVDRIVFSGGTTTFQAGGRSSGQLDVILNATNGVTTEGSGTVRLKTLDSNAGTLVTATVFNGKTWTNTGTLDLVGNSQLLLNDGTNRATFVNQGKLTGTLTGNGGVAGRTGAGGAVTLGEFVNQGSVDLSGGGQFGAHSMVQQAPSSTGAPVPSFSVKGLTMVVDEEFDRQAGTFAFDGSTLSLVRSTGELNLGSGTGLKASNSMELIAYLGPVVSDQALRSTADGAAGGKVVISANNGITIRADIDASGSSVSTGANGGSISLISQGGAITTEGVLRVSGGSSSLGGGAGGTISVQGNAASVSLGFIEAAGGEHVGVAGKAGGTVTLSGASVSTASIVADGGSASSAGAGGKGGTVKITSPGAITINGWLSASGGDGNGSGQGGGGGLVSLGTTGGAIVAHGLTANGGAGLGTGAGGNAGTLQVDNTAPMGTPDPSGSPVAGDVSVRFADAHGGRGGGNGGQGGTLAINATGQINAGAYTEGRGIDLSGGAGSLAGGTGGRVSLQSSGGNVITDGDIWVSGGASGSQTGAAGGSVSLRSTTGQLRIATVFADGGLGGAGRAGGAGGTIDGRAASLVTLSGPISANGGDGGNGATGSGGAGGAGGAVTLTQDTGALALDGLWGPGLSASGGRGGSGAGTAQSAANGGAGGSGGTVKVQATAGGLTACLTACEGLPVVAADGGSGGAAGAGGVGGAGGKGGVIDMRAAADSSLALMLQAAGGQAGSSAAAGGAGGTVGISVAGANSRLELVGQVNAAGGSASATAGQFSWTAAGGLTIPSGMVTPALQVDALWRNTGSMTLGASSLVVASQLSNAGTITLEPGSALTLGDGSGSVRLINESTGTLQGSGSVQGSLENAGILSPGTAESPIGRLAISGNLFLLPTSRVLADVVDSPIPVAGSTYDQLSIGGRASLGGLLKVTLVSTPAPTTAPSSTTLPSANVTAAVNTGLVLLDAGTVDPGTTFTALDAPASIAGQVQIAAGGVPQTVPLPTTAPVPTPAPTPAPTTAPVASAPLVNTIVSLLRGSAPAEVVQQAVVEQETVVTQFVSLLVKEQKKQEQEAKTAVVQTSTACTP